MCDNQGREEMGLRDDESSSAHKRCKVDKGDVGDIQPVDGLQGQEAEKELIHDTGGEEQEKRRVGERKWGREER